MMLFIEQRWVKTKWMFLISFILYLLFLFFFSTFLGLMYFRGENNRQEIMAMRNAAAMPMCINSDNRMQGDIL